MFSVCSLDVLFPGLSTITETTFELAEELWEGKDGNSLLQRQYEEVAVSFLSFTAT